VDMACPALFRWRHILGHKRPATDALSVGSAVHTLALEPDTFAERFYIITEGVKRDKRTQAYKAEVEEAAPEPEPVPTKTVKLPFGAFSDQGRVELVGLCETRGWRYAEAVVDRVIKIEMPVGDEVPSEWAVLA